MSEDDLIEASPCKLRSGDWGCKTQEPVEAGDTVRIVTRANKQWRAAITRVVWTDDQVCICETESAKGKTGQGASQPKPAAKKPQAQTPPKASSTDQPPLDAPDDAPPAPPRMDPMPSDELDAMADRAAEQDDAFDEMMNAQQEFERDPR